MQGRLRYKTIANPMPAWLIKDAQGNPILEGPLGDFTVPTCSFFKCVP